MSPLTDMQAAMCRAGLDAARAKWPTLCAAMSDDELWGLVSTATIAATDAGIRWTKAQSGSAESSGR